jgi:hypothetical protein
MVLVGMSLKSAQWLGMAAAVAGGCVAVSDAGRDAASVVGHDCIGRIPESWLPDASYAPLTAAQTEAVTALLSARCAGWSGAQRVNDDRAETRKLLAL